MYTFTPNTKAESAKVNQNFTDLSTGLADVDDNSLQLFRAETHQNNIRTGIIWSIGTLLTGGSTIGIYSVVDPSGDMRRIAIGTLSKTFTASKDTYIDVNHLGVPTYVEVANGATTGMTLTANSIRVAKVVTNATTITSITQGGADALGNMIYPVNPTNIKVNQTIVNTGTAAGNLLYFNLGGLKIVVGKSPNTVSGNQGTQTYVIPAGWFNTVESCISTGNEGTVDANLHWWLDGATPATPLAGFTITFNKYNNNNASATMKSSLLIIGT